MDLSNKTYTELEDIRLKLMDEYALIEKRCIHDRLDWEDACNEMRPYALKIFEVEQEIRLLETPELTYGREWKGRLMTMEEFVRMAKNGLINDSSSRSYYATTNAKSNIRIYVADVENNKVRPDFDHVIVIN